ncbi:hypothetical protein JI435_437410 [Parastagonospora nodorum SN15]|uniref:Uncharacterized protein n=1 Tax=Phaeosphaeria nodorum (strain SN15 / ATCC MYA-4574 / FGSC 10173) TaxID=321614 RepID=A0A7U2I2V6_PHANO|nr:hypothetical protein JI435_437410 [Parastagonospora nodorum SN15]
MAADDMVHSMAATTIRELGARHGLSNLSVHDLVEEFARHVSSQVQEKKIQDQNPNSNISTLAMKSRLRILVTR